MIFLNFCNHLKLKKMKILLFGTWFLFLQSCQTPQNPIAFEEFNYLIGAWEKVNENPKSEDKNWVTIMHCSKDEEEELICVTSVLNKKKHEYSFFIQNKIYAENGKWYWENKANGKFSNGVIIKSNETLQSEKYEITKAGDKKFHAKKITNQGLQGSLRLIYQEEKNKLILLNSLNTNPYHFVKID